MQRDSTRLAQPDKQQPSVRSGLVPTNVGEVQILRNQETSCLTSGSEDRRVVSSRQLFVRYGVDVVTKIGQRGDEAIGQVFVELDLHRLTCASLRGRSS